MGMGTKRTDDPYEALRRAFATSGLSLRRLSILSDTRYQSVHGFFAKRDRDAKLVTVAAWCRVLGLRLVPIKRSGR